MENIQHLSQLVLKAVAVGMSVASVVLGFFPEAAGADTRIGLLSLGLAALALAVLAKEDGPRGEKSS